MVVLGDEFFGPVVFILRDRSDYRGPVFHQTGIILKPLGHSWISRPEIVFIYFVSHFFPFLSCWNR